MRGKLSLYTTTTTTTTATTFTFYGALTCVDILVAGSAKKSRAGTGSRHSQQLAASVSLSEQFHEYSYKMSSLA